jgi:hypothetical protein
MRLDERPRVLDRGLWADLAPSRRWCRRRSYRLRILLAAGFQCRLLCQVQGFDRGGWLQLAIARVCRHG